MNDDGLLQHYMWLVLVVLLFAIGGAIYFDIQTLGLTFVLTGAMLLLAMENDHMIEAVETHKLSNPKTTPFLVHLKSQQEIAKFIFLYHMFVYSYLGLFTILSLLAMGSTTLQTWINIVLIGLFLLAAVTILIRRIRVGAKYEA